MTDAIPQDVPFSLSCAECDVDSPDTYEDALDGGWTRIQYFPQGVAENFLGLCPVCRWYEEHEDTARQEQTLPHDHQQGGDPCPI